MKISGKQRQDTLNFITDDMKTITDKYPNRSSGSDDETNTINHMNEILSNYCKYTKQDIFMTYPFSVDCWIYFIPTFIMLAQILFFFTPIFAIISLVISIMPMIFVFVLRIPILKQLSEKSHSLNLMAELKPSRSVTKRIVLVANPDSSYENRIYKLGGSKALYTVVISTAIGYLFILFSNIAAIATTGIIGTPSGWPLYCGIASIIFIPAFICCYYIIDHNTLVPGVSNNLASCELAIGTIKAIKDSQINLENTEIVVLINGGSNAGEVGSKFFIDKYTSFARELKIDTLFINYRDICSSNDLYIYTKDNNGLVKTDPALVDFIINTAKENNIEIKPISHIGSSDSAVFTKAGYKSVCITSNNKLVSNSNTVKDNVENLNIDNLGKALDLTISIIDAFSNK